LIEKIKGVDTVAREERNLPSPLLRKEDNGQGKRKTVLKLFSERVLR